MMSGHRGSRCLLAGLLSCGLLFTTASPASAHPRLRGVEPTPEATVEAPLHQVTLRFTEALDWKLSRVEVTDADGHPVTDGSPVDQRGAEGHFPIRAGVSGPMLVSWLVVGEDAHPVQGQFVFAVAPPAGSVASGSLDRQLAALSARAGAFQGRAGSTGLGWLIRGGRALEILLLYVVLGLLLLRALVLRPIPAGAGAGGTGTAGWGPPPYRTLFLAGAGSLALMPILFSLYANRVTELVEGVSVGGVLSSSLGRVWEMKAVLWALFAVASLVALRRRDDRHEGLLLALALSATGAFVLNTHAQSATPTWLYSGMMWGHVLVTAFWAGGLMAILLVVFPARDPAAVWPALGRFSNIMTVTAGAVVASGLVMLMKLAGNWKSLSCTDFGVVAQFKVAIVAVALVIGAVNNRLVANHRRGAERPSPNRRGRSVDSLRRIVVAEVVVLTSVLCLSAALGETELPPVLKGRLLPGEIQESVQPGLLSSGCRG